MPELMDEKTLSELKPILDSLVKPVRLVFFRQQFECPTCGPQLKLLEELTGLSDKLELKVYDFILNGDEAMHYRIDKVPATVVMGEQDYGIRFFGLTAGYEFSSFLQTILMVSAGRSGLEPELEALVKSIKQPVHLQVFVTTTCPYCPKMVHTAHQFAFINKNIRSHMVEGAEFPDLVQRYGVSGVPKTIVNEVNSFEGAIPEGAVFLEILKVVDPEEYEKLDAVIRESRGERKTVEAQEDHEYEMIIIGGGPAALSAAVYAARKDLDVALITKKFGGQITYTAAVENYLGFNSVGGEDLAALFRNHVEGHAIAEASGTEVIEVKRADSRFIVKTEDKRKYSAKSLVYCAGMEYRRLGVPGEETFLGRGIGFCATCDAPLYRNMKVAVVGGGNSAFTAARDLISYASEIHLIHRRREFTADRKLMEEVLGSSKIALHVPMVVHSFLGKKKLAGVRLKSTEDRKKNDIKVDGVFLEIGLSPNSAPLQRIIELNRWGEVPVERDQSTSVPGLFAAGDVTDSREKQISVAVGDGAKAALAAHKYLVAHKLTGSTKGTRETWQ